ncbi:uncharacterized protein [Parasteatoda tepidariorum]|uniref:uncharacterized protein isoform X1 n=1 Tax=Parasteatoda tepidariorum TaxID=114398 RepID=UPI00077FDADE|nr:uncharacterized protein LOC107455622 [Parasteatoda tepidariorum]
MKNCSLLLVLISGSLIIVSAKNFELKKKFALFVQKQFCGGNAEMKLEVLDCVDMFPKKIKDETISITKEKTISGALTKICNDIVAAKLVAEKLGNDETYDLGEAFWNRLEICIDF